MPSGSGENNDANKNCQKFKSDLEDALDQLDAISRGQNLPKNVAKQTEKIQKMLRDVKKYAEEDCRYYHLDSESSPKRR